MILLALDALGDAIKVFVAGLFKVAQVFLLDHFLFGDEWVLLPGNDEIIFGGSGDPVGKLIANLRDVMLFRNRGLLDHLI